MVIIPLYKMSKLYCHAQPYCVNMWKTSDISIIEKTSKCRKGGQNVYLITLIIMMKATKSCFILCKVLKVNNLPHVTVKKTANIYAEKREKS